MAERIECDRMQREKLVLSVDAEETRQLSLQLAKTVQSLRDERDKLEQEVDEMKIRLSSKDLILQDCLHGMSSASGSVKQLMEFLREMLRTGSRERSSSTATAPSAADSPPVSPAGQAQLTQRVLQGLTADVATSLELAERLMSSPAAINLTRGLPPNLATKTLEAKVTYLRGKLEMQPKYELENDRLRRALKAKNKQSRSSSPEAAYSVDALEEAATEARTYGYHPTPPERRPHARDASASLSCSPPAVVRMPGCAEEGTNATMMPVRSCGVQCVLLGDSGRFRMSSHMGLPHQQQPVERLPSIDGRDLRNTSAEYALMGGYDGVRRAVSPSALQAVRRTQSPGGSRRTLSPSATSRRTISPATTPRGSVGPRHLRSAGASPAGPRRRAPSPGASPLSPSSPNMASRTQGGGRLQGLSEGIPNGPLGGRRSATPTHAARGGRGSSRSNTPTHTPRNRSLTPVGSRPVTPARRLADAAPRSVTPSTRPLSPRVSRPVANRTASPASTPRRGGGGVPAVSSVDRGEGFREKTQPRYSYHRWQKISFCNF